jgi:AcrR family transcriptional regulator
MPVQGKTKQQIVTEFRRTEILDAARTVFASKGFDAATIDDIALATGVAKGTIYLYYPSKREVYWAALQAGVDELYAETTRRVADVESVRDKVRAFVQTKLEYCDLHRDFFCIYYSAASEVLSGPPERLEVTALYRQQLDLLEHAFEAGRTRSEIRDIDCARLAVAVFEITRGLITQRLLGRTRDDIQQDVDFAVDLIWTGVGRT